jgi:hypothetical protein
MDAASCPTHFCSGEVFQGIFKSRGLSEMEPCKKFGQIWVVPVPVLRPYWPPSHGLGAAASRSNEIVFLAADSLQLKPCDSLVHTWSNFVSTYSPPDVGVCT